MYAEHNQERMDELLAKIQNVQEELNRLVKPIKGGCSTQEILRLSQILDGYINAYHRMEKHLD